MPHQNVHSSTATAQNAATDPVAPRDRSEDRRPEPHSYAAADVGDSSLAPPAAGEVADYMDEGDALAADDVQQGATNANRPDNTDRAIGQGPKTKAANQARLKGES